MARALPPQALGSLAALALVLVVIGGMGYLYLVQAVVPAAAVPTSQYATTVVTKDLTITPATLAKNVFAMTGPSHLRQDSIITPDQVSYQSSEIGKTDLSQSGK